MSQSETLMLLILGFSVAAFLGLIGGRIAWKLAFRLGARHTQRNMPSNMIELQTDRDRMRAEHAMMAKKLELRLSDIRMRMAEQTAEVSRHRNRFEILKQDLAKRDEELLERNAEIVTLRDRVSELETQVEERDGEIQALNESLVEVEEVEIVDAKEATGEAPPVPNRGSLEKPDQGSGENNQANLKAKERRSAGIGAAGGDDRERNHRKARRQQHPGIRGAIRSPRREDRRNRTGRRRTAG